MESFNLLLLFVSIAFSQLSFAANRAPNPDSGDYYERLGIRTDTSPQDIKKAFHEAATMFHPDTETKDKAKRDALEKKFQYLSEAYSVLSNPKKRAIYDQRRNYSNAHSESADAGTSTKSASPQSKSTEQLERQKTYDRKFKAMEETHRQILAFINDNHVYKMRLNETTYRLDQIANKHAHLRTPAYRIMEAVAAAEYKRKEIDLSYEYLDRRRNFFNEYWHDRNSLNAAYSADCVINSNGGLPTEEVSKPITYNSKIGLSKDKFELLKQQIEIEFARVVKAIKPNIRAWDDLEGAIQAMEQMRPDYENILRDIGIDSGEFYQNGSKRFIKSEIANFSKDKNSIRDASLLLKSLAPGKNAIRLRIYSLAIDAFPKLIASSDDFKDYLAHLLRYSIASYKNGFTLNHDFTKHFAMTISRLMHDFREDISRYNMPSNPINFYEQLIEHIFGKEIFPHQDQREAALALMNLASFERNKEAMRLIAKGLRSDFLGGKLRSESFKILEQMAASDQNLAEELINLSKEARNTWGFLDFCSHYLVEPFRWNSKKQ